MRWALFVLPLLCAAQDTHVVLLGTGTPNPEPEHSGPSVAIVSGDQVYIVDAGPGIVRRAAQAGIKMEQLTKAFITHLHSDHTIGYPDLILTPAVTGRKGALDVYGPPGLRAMTNHILEAWKEDVDIRLHGGEPSLPEAYVVRPHEIKPGEIFRDTWLKVIAFPVDHGTWKYAYGYRFEAQDKVIVVSGDTTYSPRLVEAAKGCDILVHEVYSAAALAKRTPDWQKYHSTFHTSGADLGRIATEVHPKKLVLYHELPFSGTREDILREVRSHYRGDVIEGQDLQVIR